MQDLFSNASFSLMLIFSVSLVRRGYMARKRFHYLPVLMSVLSELAVWVHGRQKRWRVPVLVLLR